MTAELRNKGEERAPAESDRGSDAQDGGSDRSAKSEREDVNGKRGDAKWGKNDFSLPPPAIPSGFGAEEHKFSESPRAGGNRDEAEVQMDNGRENTLAKAGAEGSPVAATSAESGTGGAEHGSPPANRRPNAVERPELDSGTVRRSKKRSDLEAPAGGRRKKR